MEACKLCNSKKISEYFDNKLLKCDDCGIVFLSSNLKINNLDDYYSKNNHYSAINFNDLKYKIIKENVQKTLKLISKKIEIKNKTLLDIGANTGAFVKEAIRFGVDALGLETNESTVKEVNKNNNILIRGNIELEDNYFINKTFDVISIFHVLEHLESPQKVVKKINKLLNPGGYLIIEVPNIESYAAKKDKLSWKYIALEHLYYFSPQVLSNLLENNGFKIIYTKIKNNEIKYFSLKKSFKYIFGSPNNLERLKMKNYNSKNTEKIVKNNYLKKIVKSFLFLIINLLNRGDHILVIAKKNNI